MKIADQLIRPTGIVDPMIEVKKSGNQVDDLLQEIQKEILKKNKILVTTLTKKMAEELTEYYANLGIKVRYMHSDIDTIERVNIIRGLRKGEFDVLVGINLLREGLDLPEVSLVAILDADKEGFLRSETSLIQTVGRAARNSNGKVIMYADNMTGSMQRAITETYRRREIQINYNKENNITPTTIFKEIRGVIAATSAAEGEGNYSVRETIDRERVKDEIIKLSTEMVEAAEALEFEKAASLRDRIRELESKL